MEEGIRLNKYLSEAGICSRRAADKLIEEGKVKVNGVVATLGTKVHPSDKVEALGNTASAADKKVVLAYNKPIGIECTSDTSNKDNIIDAINYPTRVYNVGRLDKNSCGLIFMTNDGELANFITKAGEKHEKEYFVKVNKPITDEFINGMKNGVPILDKITAPCKVYKKSDNTFTIVLIQGLNRQIRRMCEYFGYKVTFLKRVRIMNVNLGDLGIGKYRELTNEEIEGLYKLRK